MRVRHHTDDEHLEGIKLTMVIDSGRGVANVAHGVHVEVEPFGTTKPGGPKADLGLPKDGAFVEFELTPELQGNMVRYYCGRRNTAVIPTSLDEGLSLQQLKPKFVKVRRNFWEYWRTKPERGSILS